MLKLPLQMPKNCIQCPFVMPETFYNGRKKHFFCYLIYALQGYGGYEDKYHDLIMKQNFIIKDAHKIKRGCLLKSRQRATALRKHKKTLAKKRN